MNFSHYWYLFLLIPFGLFWWMFVRERRGLLFLLFILIGVLALMNPYLMRSDNDCHVVLVVDRSLSIDEINESNIKEQVKRALSYESDQNKLSIVTFGRNVSVEKMFNQNYYFEDYVRFIDSEASSLNDAISIACSIINLNESGKILVMSDGQYQGANPMKAASEAIGRGIKIDQINVSSNWENDVAVEEILLPSSIARNELFQFSIVIKSNFKTSLAFNLYRDEVLIKTGHMQVDVGQENIPVIDRISETGVAKYFFEIKPQGDGYQNNNFGKGVLACIGEKGVLVINTEGKANNFTRAIEGAGHIVKVIKPKDVEIDLGFLFKYKIAILENVPADMFQQKELDALKEFVLSYGMSLAMTGGRASFGMGGYYQSPIDEILPVDLVKKDEIRKLNTALSIVLDRSGSMSAHTSSGKTKMDLANMGSVSAIDMLGAQDEVSVFAVDSEAHSIVPISRLGSNLEGIKSRVLSIESTGGGIYTYQGLKAAAISLSESKAAVRHIIIFADAADAEEPGDYKNLCAKLVASGVSVSVIALGSNSDYDAEFLTDLAKRGQGSIYFTMDEAALPRLFTQDVINVARNSFLEEVMSFSVRPELNQLGAFKTEGIPGVKGANLNYLREGAKNGLILNNEYLSPGLSVMKVGAGKSMAVSFELDGPYTGPFKDWHAYDNFIANLIGWLNPTSSANSGVLEAQRKGNLVQLSLYYDAKNLILEDQPSVEVMSYGKYKVKKSVLLRPTARGVLEGSYRLENSEIHYHSAKLNQDAVVGNALQLPYSPEYELNNADRAEVLEGMVERSGGKTRLLVNEDVWQDRFFVDAFKSIQYPLIVAMMVLLLLEIAQRRLGLNLLSKFSFAKANSEDYVVGPTGKKKIKAKKSQKDKDPSSVNEKAKDDEEFYLAKIKKR